MQFFVNIFAASVALIFGFRAFAGLVETEKPYNADAFFAGGMLVAGFVAFAFIAYALRDRYKTADASIRQWYQNVVLTFGAFMLALATVAGFMSSIPAGIISVIVGFVVFVLTLREFRDGVEGYENGKELALMPSMVLAIFGTVGTSFFIDERPILAFALVSLLMFVGAITSGSIVTVPKNAVGVVVKHDPGAEPQKPASDAPGQIVDRRV